MKKSVLIFMLLIFSITKYSWAQQHSGLPIDFVGGCEIDLNKDGNLDIALLINTTEGYKLMVVIRHNSALRTLFLGEPLSKGV